MQHVPAVPAPSATARGGGRLARLLRLLTAVLLLGTALLVVALLGQSAAARELVPSRDAGATLPAARPAGRAAVRQDGTPTLEQVVRDAQAFLRRQQDGDLRPLSTAAVPVPAGTGRQDPPGGDSRAIAPHLDHAARPERRPAGAERLAAEEGDGNGGLPLPDGSFLVAGPVVAPARPEHHWVRWLADASPLTYPFLRLAARLAGARPEPAGQQADAQAASARPESAGQQADAQPQPVWPGVQFEPGATAARLDNQDKQLVVPFGQIKLPPKPKGGGLRTYDGSRIVDGRLLLNDMVGTPVVSERNGYTEYDTGVIDYGPETMWARYLPRTNTVLTRHPKVLVLAADRKTPVGEVKADGSYLSYADGTRTFPDGTELVGEEWQLPGGLRVTADGRFLEADGTEIDLADSRYGGVRYLGRGTRVRDGGPHAGPIIDFAGGGAGYPGGVVIENAGRVDQLLRGRSTPEADGSEAPTPHHGKSPQQLALDAERLEAALWDVRYEGMHRYKGMHRWWRLEPDALREQPTLEWRKKSIAEDQKLRHAGEALEAEYEALKEAQRYPPELDDQPVEALRAQARQAYDEMDAHLKEVQALADREAPTFERHWSTFGHWTEITRRWTKIDNVAEALWARPGPLQRRLVEVKSWPDSPEKDAELARLREQEAAAVAGYRDIRSTMLPLPSRYLELSEAELKGKIESVAAKLKDNHRRLAALDPNAEGAPDQIAAIKEENSLLKRQYNEFHTYLKTKAPPPSATPRERQQPQHRSEAPEGLEAPEAPGTRLAGGDGPGQDADAGAAASPQEQQEQEAARSPLDVLQPQEASGGQGAATVTATGPAQVPSTPPGSMMADTPGQDLAVGLAETHADAAGQPGDSAGPAAEPGGLYADIDGSSFLDSAHIG
jgi:hypothetical protein